MTTSERFLEVMEGLKIGPYVLEKDCGVKNAQAKISHYKKGVTKAISGDIIVQLCEAYPQVNANYILTGKGPMFLDNETSHSSLSEKDVEDLPSPETAEYWKRMYETTVVMYEAQFEDLQRRFNALNKSVEEIQDLFSVRRKAV
ncbi:hypothetical protein [Bacteroides stercoris]|jgi:hypothetical protein|uniref:hypothetical protein n=1 Tax=Bacteroides stercoris TaxID=46506 RepID=UPI00356AB59E